MTREPAATDAQREAGEVEALAAGAKGILFASKLEAGGLNLVVYNDLLAADDTVQVYDPTGALPKNQDSWR